MCRLLGYLGSTTQLDRILYKPEHSLISQSYQPREMTAGLLNADGFGVGWYHAQKEANPYTYRNILPIWSDINLPHLSRYVESNCILAHVRSATPPLAVDLTNCQPFSDENLLFIHNGFIHNFRQTLYRPIRNRLDDYTYQLITGTTDSEHIFALIVSEWRKSPDRNLEKALTSVLFQLTELAKIHHIYFSANIILSNGKQLVASRYSNRAPTPTLYYLKDDPFIQDAALVASEPLFDGNWQSCPEHSILSVNFDAIASKITVDLKQIL
jgi:ergothioneine biosynthesis protein EgtC